MLIEAGDDQYTELRGLHLETEVALHNELELVVKFAEELSRRYGPDGQELNPEALEVFRAQAPKRTVIEFVPVKTISWDHRKLGGVY